MNQNFILLVWCWSQSFVIAGLSLVLSGLALRRSPSASAAIAGAGVTATLLLTLLAPVPVPRWELQFGDRLQPLIPSNDVSSLRNVSATKSIPTEGPAVDSNFGAKWDWRILGGMVTSLRNTQEAVVVPPTAGPIVFSMVMLGVLLSIARVAHGVWMITGLHTESGVIADERLSELVNVLSLKLGLRWLPRVREHRRLVSAVVVGWWRPTVMLPCAWRRWSAAELQAVVAHELAHIRRHDSKWRLITAFTVALQCTQPLLYWLRRQMILAQEVTADELAAAAVGSRAAYLYALSQLALRQDGQPTEGPTAMLLPVFSGYLLRRIEMLRAKDCSMRRALRTTMQCSAIVMVIAAAASTTALRGLAQSPDTKADESVRVARGRDSKGKAVEGAADAHAVAATLFRRPVFDLAQAGVHDSEGFIVRLGEILGRPELADQARELDDWFATQWKKTFPAEDVLAWSLRDIEYIAGSFRFAIKPLPMPTENGSNQMMFGSRWLVIRYLQPVNERFESLLRFAARTDQTSVTKKSHGRMAMIELPIIPMIGPKRMCVSQLDDRTILIAEDEATLIGRLDISSQKTSLSAWHKTWAGVEGGLISLIATDKEIAHPLADPVDDDARIFADLFQAHRYAVGLDYQSGAKGVGVLKAQFSFDEETKADQFHHAMLRVVDRYVRENSAKDSGATGDKTLIATGATGTGDKTLIEFLTNAKVVKRAVDGGWQVDVQLAAPFDFKAHWSSPTR